MSVSYISRHRQISIPRGTDEVAIPRYPSVPSRAIMPRRCADILLIIDRLPSTLRRAFMSPDDDDDEDNDDDNDDDKTTTTRRRRRRREHDDYFEGLDLNQS